MKITESAANAILQTMIKQNLDPEKFLLQFEELDGGTLGFTFTETKDKQYQNHYGLKVFVHHKAKLDGVTVDFGEINGKKGIIFLENTNDSINRKGN